MQGDACALSTPVRVLSVSRPCPVRVPSVSVFCYEACECAVFILFVLIAFSFASAREFQCEGRRTEFWYAALESRRYSRMGKSELKQATRRGAASGELSQPLAGCAIGQYENCVLCVPWGSVTESACQCAKIEHLFVPAKSQFTLDREGKMASDLAGLR